VPQVQWADYGAALETMGRLFGGWLLLGILAKCCGIVGYGRSTLQVSDKSERDAGDIQSPATIPIIPTTSVESKVATSEVIMMRVPSDGVRRLGAVSDGGADEAGNENGEEKSDDCGDHDESSFCGVTLN